MKVIFSLFAALCSIPLNASAQSTISTIEKYAYSANSGWIDFRPSLPDGSQVFDSAISGYAYAANLGWIHFGNGTPANGHTYSNTSATDYGVNISPAGNLTGYAYAANIGWITFEQTHGQTKLDLRTGKFTGNAYAANIGWIALDTAFSDLATSTIARPDSDTDGIADTWEMLNFGNLTTATLTSDKDGDGASDLAEYNAGTLPNDPTSFLRIVSHTYTAGYSRAEISFTTVPTRNYRLEHDEDLVGPWTDSQFGTFPSAGSLTTRTLTGLSSVPRRFFRAVAMPLPSAP